ncbi:MAG: aromatic ring-hydroxylating dioxygenase subunit alpha [Pseudomonadota bacterium]
MSQKSGSDAPGSARAPGPTVADVLRGDSMPPPDPLLQSAYSFLGDADIATYRYTSEAFLEHEMRSMWSRCWQWACREEHVPEVGDTYVYDIGHYSIIVVRSQDDCVRAFRNSCTHRGTRLLAGQGSGYSPAFTCPFHGWSWELDGSIRNIPARWDFPHVGSDSHGLVEVQCQRWGGFVFINLDLSAPPLEQQLEVLPEHFKHFPLDRRRIRLHVEKKLPANWKAAQEAFMEGYHNFETHDAPNGANTQYDVFGRYVTRFIHNIGHYSPESLADYPGDRWRQPPLTENEQLQALSVLGVHRETVPAGETARSVAAQELRQSFGSKLGIDLSSVSESLLLDSIEYHLFPNMFLFPGITVPMVYRFRPDGKRVDQSVFDLLLLEPIPEGASHPPPPEPVQLDVDQSYTEVAELAWLGALYDEDTVNLAMQQQGLESAGKRGITLGNYQEARIRRVHMTLDEYLQQADEQ